MIIRLDVSYVVVIVIASWVVSLIVPCGVVATGDDPPTHRRAAAIAMTMNVFIWLWGGNPNPLNPNNPPTCRVQRAASLLFFSLFSFYGPRGHRKTILHLHASSLVSLDSQHGLSG